MACFGRTPLATTKRKGWRAGEHDVKTGLVSANATWIRLQSAEIANFCKPSIFQSKHDVHYFITPT